MRQHHTKVHGNPLRNRTCKGCETAFYDAKAQRAFCDDCNPNAGPNNGNWKGAKEVSNCARCGATFDYYPSDKRGLYCPDCIENGTGLTELGTGQTVERVEVVCEQCEGRFTVRKTRIERDSVRFCSHKCHHKWMSENLGGETHHRWKGGDVEYGGKWWQIRQEALTRDGYTCQSCGTTRDDLNTNPHVHHIKPIRDFENPQDAHTIDNVVTLCPRCHGKVENGAIPVPDGTWNRK